MLNNNCNRGRLDLSFLANVTPQIEFVLCVMEILPYCQLFYFLPWVDGAWEMFI